MTFPVQPRFPGLDSGYESFYLRAVDPERPRSVWLRHTVHKAAGHPAVGSTWLTRFDREQPEPLTAKTSVPGPTVPDGRWLRVGESVIGPDGADGPDWQLRWRGTEAPLRHLPSDWMYRGPLPRTKLESPLPAITVDGRVGETAVDGWTGMLGHNWGAQHAERWIWLHGVAFEDVPGAWLDLAFGRIKVGRATTPWIGNGVVSAGGRRFRFGGLGRARRTKVHEDPLRLDLEIAGEDADLELTVHSPRPHTVVWRYADPDGSEHHVANCSIALIDGFLRPRGGTPLHLHTEHGGAYELGMRETDHGLPVQPFSDP